MKNSFMIMQYWVFVQLVYFEKCKWIRCVSRRFLESKFWDFWEEYPNSQQTTPPPPPQKISWFISDPDAHSIKEFSSTNKSGKFIYGNVNTPMTYLIACTSVNLISLTTFLITNSVSISDKSIPNSYLKSKNY